MYACYLFSARYLLYIVPFIIYLFIQLFSHFFFLFGIPEKSFPISHYASQRECEYVSIALMRDNIILSFYSLFLCHRRRRHHHFPSLLLTLLMISFDLIENLIKNFCVAYPEVLSQFKCVCTYFAPFWILFLINLRIGNFKSYVYIYISCMWYHFVALTSLRNQFLALVISFISCARENTWIISI